MGVILEMASVRRGWWCLRRIHSQALPFQARPRRWADAPRGGPRHHRRVSFLSAGPQPQHSPRCCCCCCVSGIIVVHRPISNNAAADNENKVKTNSHDRDVNNPAISHQHQQDADDEAVVQDDKWEHAIHPFQEPYWTGRKDPAEYLEYMQNVTLPQLRRTRRQRDLMLLRQAEQVVWQVELMHRAYRDIIVALEANTTDQNNETTTTTHATAAEEKNYDSSPASTGAFVPPNVVSRLASARQRYQDARQEALEERLEFVRLRKRHLQGKNHYQIAMQHLPIPEPLSDADISDGLH